jgi:transmembrane sensor
MQPNTNRITELTWKYLKGDLTEVEQLELDAWLADPYNKRRFEERIKAENMLEGMTLLTAATEEVERVGVDGNKSWVDFDRNKLSISSAPERRGEGRRTRWTRMVVVAAAACALLAVAGGTFWKLKQERELPRTTIARSRQTLGPGRNKATLILADHKEVSLDDARQGEIARQGNTEIAKTDSALLTYRTRSLNHNHNHDVAFNTVVTPRGGQYKLQLADGTTVFLNAESSLRFPVAFEGKERRVILEGEGYFEVAKDASRPFVVELKSGREITVLGTRFDVRAYVDEPVESATLLEGSVRVASGERSAVLAVNDRVALQPDGSLLVTKDDWADASIAWTRGLFRFRNASLGEVMRQIARWYDVDVEFGGAVPDVPITASISRNTSAWDVLDALKEIAGLHYTIEGRKVIVLH